MKMLLTNNEKKMNEEIRNLKNANETLKEENDMLANKFENDMQEMDKKHSEEVAKMFDELVRYKIALNKVKNMLRDEREAATNLRDENDKLRDEVMNMANIVKEMEYVEDEDAAFVNWVWEMNEEEIWNDMTMWEGEEANVPYSPKGTNAENNIKEYVIDDFEIENKINDIDLDDDEDDVRDEIIGVCRDMITDVVWYYRDAFRNLERSQKMEDNVVMPPSGLSVFDL